MPISWNEIRTRAVAFSKEWASEAREHAEAKSFWDQFFNVFGLSRRLVASFEEPVRGLSGSYGFIDLFWKSMLLAEHKSRGKDLGKAHAQALDYIQDLARYSARLVYNNYPWPQEVSEAKREAVEAAAQAVLDARDAHPNSSLADLYDPLAMPAELTKAHAKLDRAVDRCYRSQPFASERNRVEFLFGLYQQLTSPLLSTERMRRQG